MKKTLRTGRIWLPVCSVLALLTLVLSVSCGGGSDQRAPEAQSPQYMQADIPVGEIYTYAAEQLRKSVADVETADQFPFYTTEDGTWENRDSAWWCSGFFAGSLWLVYDYTSDEFFKDAAVKWTEGMAAEQNNASDADIGYKILNSYLIGYNLTGDESYKEAVLNAGRAIASRYNGTVGVVKGYDGANDWQMPLVIDHMMNIDLLWWGARNGGDPAWRDMAISHSDVTMATTIRPDGSSIQVVDLDPETGEVVKNDTLCGLSGDSVWARGQGEGIYGFAIAYRETQNPAYLEAFKKLADYFIANLPADNVPYWDFKDPDIPNTIRDSSAASMTADGLLEMVALLPDGPDRVTYYNAAVTILESLADAYLTVGTPSLGLLTHGSFQGPEVMGADTSLVFGDFNFLSALKKYEDMKDLMM